MTEEQSDHFRSITLRTFLNERLDEARGSLLRLHVDAAQKHENIFKSTKMIHQYYKFMHRIEVLTEMLEELG